MEETRKLIVEKFKEAVKLRDPRESKGNLLLKLLYNPIHIFMSFTELLVERLDRVLSPERRTRESTVDFLLKTFNQLHHTMDNIWALFVDKFSQVLPPESSSQTLHLYVHVGLTRVLPATLVLLFLRCCYRCCSKYGRSAGKMMKAPGRKGAVIARAPFQDNPRDYFRNLRGKK